MTTDQIPAAGAVSLVNVSKGYDPKHPDQLAVDSVNLEIAAGTFVTLLGPSGCGKTTTLRMIAGFENPTAGDVLLDGASVLTVTPDKRPMSMVFQSYALFPHLTVRDNVSFGLKMKKLSRPERQRRVDDGLSMMGIEQFADRFPHQLSGGQQQRVALARALVMEPKMVLFDEPLSNLDARLRVRMRQEIRALQQRLGLTAIFVTHDQSEALTMSDVIVVMSHGRIEQVGSPTEIYRHPVNKFVASFLGTSNFIDGTVSAVGAGQDGRSTYTITTDLGPFEVPGLPDMRVGEAVHVVVRSEDLTVGDPTAGSILAEVESVAFDGSIIGYSVTTRVGSLSGQAAGSATMHQVGTPVGLTVDPTSLWAIPSGSEVA